MKKIYLIILMIISKLNVKTTISLKKNTLLLFLFSFSYFYGCAQIYSNGTGGGAWKEGTTWSGGNVPIAGQDVVITGNDDVTISTSTDNEFCKEIIINSDATLTISDGSLTTTQHFEVNGALNFTDGILNIGNAQSDYFDVSSSGNIYVSGGIINVSGRYRQLSGGNAYFSGDAIMNLSTAGAQTYGINTFSVTTDGIFSVEPPSTVQIILKNGNTGSAVDIYYSPTTSNFNSGTIIVENDNGVDDIIVDSDMPIYKIESKVGSGNTLHLDAGCDFSLTDLTITSGTVQIDEGAKITTTGTITTNNALVIESTAEGTGSLIIEGTATGNVTVERYLSHDTWHYISGQTNITGNFSTLSMGLTGGANGDQFYRWDEDLELASTGEDGTWVDILNGNGSGTLMDDEGFVSCMGYGINYITTDETLSLSGVPYTTDQSLPVTLTAGSTGEGSNLVGNPFTSTIAINTNGDEGGTTFLADNAAIINDTYEAVYLWNESNDWAGGDDDYVTIASSSAATYLQPGQAFMIIASNNGNIDFNTSIQKHGDGDFYKSDENKSRIYLTSNIGENHRSKTEIVFLPNMTNGLDPSYDAGRLGSAKSLALYTRLIEDNGTNFAIQALSDENIASSVIPVGVDVSETSIVTFSVETEFLAEYPVFLKDNKTNTLTNLKEESYTTQITESGIGRFELCFSPVGIEETNVVNQIQVYTSSNTITLLNNSNAKGDISIVNIMGQEIASYSLNGNSKQQISIQANSGVYIVNVRTSNGNVVSEKVIITK